MNDPASTNPSGILLTQLPNDILLVILDHVLFYPPPVFMWSHNIGSLDVSKVLETMSLDHPVLMVSRHLQALGMRLMLTKSDVVFYTNHHFSNNWIISNTECFIFNKNHVERLLEPQYIPRCLVLVPYLADPKWTVFIKSLTLHRSADMVLQWNRHGFYNKQKKLLVLSNLTQLAVDTKIFHQLYVKLKQRFSMFRNARYFFTTVTGGYKFDKGQSMVPPFAKSIKACTTKTATSQAILHELYACGLSLAKTVSSVGHHVSCKLIDFESNPLGVYSFLWGFKLENILSFIDEFFTVETITINACALKDIFKGMTGVKHVKFMKNPTDPHATPVDYSSIKVIIEAFDKLKLLCIESDSSDFPAIAIPKSTENMQLNSSVMLQKDACLDAETYANVVDLRLNLVTTIDQNLGFLKAPSLKTLRLGGNLRANAKAIGRFISLNPTISTLAIYLEVFTDPELKSIFSAMTNIRCLDLTWTDIYQCKQKESYDFPHRLCNILSYISSVEILMLNGPQTNSRMTFDQFKRLLFETNYASTRNLTDVQIYGPWRVNDRNTRWCALCNLFSLFFYGLSATEQCNAWDKQFEHVCTMHSSQYEESQQIVGRYHILHIHVDKMRETWQIQ